MQKEAATLQQTDKTRRVALVTGGGRGIGRSLALALSQAGHDVAIVGRSGAALEATAQELAQHGVRTLAITCDVSDRNQVDAVVQQVTGALGTVDVLVSNAGIAPSMRFADTSDDVWHQTMAVNAAGPFYLCRAVLPAMLAQKWGRILIIASTASKVGYRYSAAYVASKHAALGLSRALALEVARSGVTVNAICPGFVDTDIARAAVDNIVEQSGRSAADARRALEAMSPQNRLMQPDEVAALAVYLASDAARGINGQSIVIDGGGLQS